MKTIVLTTDPTPDLNCSTLNIDFNNFDPHTGPAFWVTFYNSGNTIIDRKIQALSLEEWQNWSAEEDEITDYLYVADKVTENLGVTYKEMISPTAPAPVPPAPEPVSEPTPAP